MQPPHPFALLNPCIHLQIHLQTLINYLCLRVIGTRQYSCWKWPLTVWKVLAIKVTDKVGIFVRDDPLRGSIQQPRELENLVVKGMKWAYFVKQSTTKIASLPSKSNRPMIKSIDTSSYFRLGMALGWRRPRYRTVSTLLRWQISNSATTAQYQTSFSTSKSWRIHSCKFCGNPHDQWRGMHPMLKSLFYKWRSMLLIVVIFKVDDTILDSPRLALFATNNALLKLNCIRTHYEIYKEPLYRRRLYD